MVPIDKSIQSSLSNFADEELEISYWGAGVIDEKKASFSLFTSPEAGSEPTI